MENEIKTGCVCPLAGFCSRHNIEKTPHLHKLCQNHPVYFEKWEQCRGPGQQNVTCVGDRATEELATVVNSPKEPPETIDVKMPSIIQQAKNLATATKDHVKNGMRMVTEEKKAERLTICSTCPYFKKESMRCGHCGCFLETKTKWESSKCPIQRW